MSKLIGRNRRQTRRTASTLHRATGRMPFETLEGRTLFSVFTVTNTLDSGSGSLRQAIVDANANANSGGPDQINFNMDPSLAGSGGAWTISLSSALPQVTDTVAIDGTTQSGFAGLPLIELQGGSAGAGAVGLDLAGAGSRVSGLALNGFTAAGVVIEPSADGVTVSGNFIGTDVTGTFGIANQEGVIVKGAFATLSGNVISGNSDMGVQVLADHASLRGNFIGTDVTGSMNVGNLFGVVVTAGHTMVGGATSARNIISGNIEDGVLFSGTVAGDNFVQGNYIGTDVSGTHQLGNGGNGVDVQGSSAVQIGGSIAGTGNLITANFTNGVQITDSSGVVVAGNIIGLDATGTITLDPMQPVFIGSLGNNGNGVYVSGASSNITIGWTNSDSANLISNNLGDGVRVETTGSGVTTIEGNRIGTDISGASPLGNVGNGVTVLTGAVLVGGAGAGAGNIISGNQQSGIGLGLDNTSTESGAIVEGNLIGVAIDGRTAMGNAGDGITVWGSNNAIGGAGPGAANILANNSANGVAVYQGTGNSIRGNAVFANGFIGVDLGGNGITDNDTATHVGPNNYQNFPLFTRIKNIAGQTTVYGTLSAAPNTTFLVDFYGNSTVDANGFSQAEVFLGTVAITTDSTGAATFSKLLGALPANVQFVTATATDAAGNTSEFGRNVAVPPPTFPVATQTTISSSANPSIIGQNITLTATVSASSATIAGAVTFMEGNTILGSAAVDANGVAVLTTSSLSVGPHNITAIFAAADNDQLLNSASPALAQQVNLVQTSTTLASSANPGTAGQSITLTATVSAGSGVAAGMVTFMEGTTTLGTATLDANGVGTLDISSLSVGNHTITAIFAEHLPFAASSASLMQQVNAAPVVLVQTTTILTSSVNPALVGQSVTLRATVGPVSGAIPTGTVTFMEGSNSLGTVALDANGVAALPISTLSLGSHNIVAVYSGDSAFKTSTSDVLAEVVKLAVTSTTLTSSLNPATVGQAVTLTAMVSTGAPGVPTGAITFMEGSNVLSVVAIDASGKATLTITNFSVGTHNITAAYSGDGKFAASAANPLAQKLVAAQTSTTLTSSANPSQLGQAITLTAAVSNSTSLTPTGAITFKDGSTVLATVAVDGSGKATYAISNLSLGSHNITATYSGDANFLASAGAMSQLVNPVPAKIGGHVFQDVQGDGLTPDDLPEAGVTIQLYADSNGNGKLDSTDALLTTTLTAADGSFAFANLPLGKYLVQEVAPANFVRTAPALLNYYFNNAASSGTVVTTDDFANFQKCNCASEIKNVKYTLTNKYGQSTTVTDLRGHTADGETVKVTFTALAGCYDTFSLVSYAAPDATFNANDAYMQSVLQSQTIQTHGPGTYTLTVQLPPSGHYQVDFVCGNVIYHFGPAGSNIFYSAQGRLISADNE